VDVRAAMKDVLLRQPLDRRTGRADLLRLRRRAPVAAVELRRRRSRDQRVRVRFDGHTDTQFVAADHAARRMHDIEMARSAFRMKGPLDDERPAMPPFEQPRDAVARRRPQTDPQAELGLPAPGCAAGYTNGRDFVHVIPSGARARGRR
jgi:hypothetical protein